MNSQIVNDTEEIIAKLQNLPPQQQQQVVDFIEFLGHKYAQQQLNQSQSKPRVFDCSSNSRANTNYKYR